MAKRKTTKKKTTRRKAAPEPEEPNLFVRQVGVVLLFVLALLVLLGGFNTGGPLPTGIFGLLETALGLAAYLAPVALIYWGVFKFRDEEHNLQPGRLISMGLILLLSAALFHTIFYTTDAPATEDFGGGKGGGIGALSGGLLLTALDKIPSVVVLAVLLALAVFWAFSIQITSLFGLFRPSGRSDSDGEGVEFGDAQVPKNGERKFKLTEGVPVEHAEDKASAKVATRHSSLKNTAEKLKPEEDHKALTAASDPDWKFPSTDLLIKKQDKADAGDVETNVEIIEDTFHNFNISVQMEGANVGPRVTQYTLKPPSGTKLSKISALDRELALNLAAQSIRIEAPIPGKRAVGVEVPNVKSATVRMSSILEDKEWNGSNDPLKFVVGRDIAGKPIVGNLSKMPHLLIAGQTGSGKSVMINTLITSLLYNNSPADLKLIMVDPKQVELTPYNDIPHLLTPVITEPEKCISALKWAVSEMERRLRTFSEHNKRDIAEYNKLKDEESMPYVVVVIDELSDLMMAAARDVEALIVRIAQKARAAGIHLVLATQRPSVDVITGLIKANVPGRIAFTVASQVDSRTILDGAGAEKLLGMGDMLYSTSAMPKPLRVQGAFITDDETIKVNDFLRMQRPPQYDDEVVSQPVQLNGKGGIVVESEGSGGSSDDDMFADAVRVVVDNNKASTSLLQRRLKIGYGRASRIMDEMEERGIIGAADGSRPRDVLISSVADAFGAGETPQSSDSEEDAMYDENFS